MVTGNEPLQVSAGKTGTYVFKKKKLVEGQHARNGITDVQGKKSNPFARIKLKLLQKGLLLPRTAALRLLGKRRKDYGTYKREHQHQPGGEKRIVPGKKEGIHTLTPRDRENQSFRLGSPRALFEKGRVAKKKERAWKMRPRGGDRENNC